MFVCIPFWDDCIFDDAQIGVQQARASHLAMQQVDCCSDVASDEVAFGHGVGPFCKLQSVSYLE